MSRKGQLLVLAAAILASAVLAYLAWYSATLRSYRIMKFCGPLESAELIAVARASVAWNESLDVLLARLRELGRKYGHCVELYDVAVQDYTLYVANGSGLYRVALQNRLGVISYVAEWNSSFEEFYVKETPYGSLIYALYRLRYANYYSAPQWGVIEHCPKLQASEDVDLWPAGSCEWLVGVPANQTATLRDEFGVPVRVGG